MPLPVLCFQEVLRFGTFAFRLTKSRGPVESKLLARLASAYARLSLDKAHNDVSLRMEEHFAAGTLADVYGPPA